MRLGGFSLSRHRYQKGRMLIQNDITYHESITCTETHTAAGGRSVTYALVAAGALGVRFWPVSEDRNPKRFGDVTVVTKHVRSVLNILRYDLVTRRIHCAIDITHRDDRRYYDESHTQGGQHFTLTGYTKTLENINKNNEETPFLILMEKETHVFMIRALKWLMGLRLAVQFGKSGFGL